MQYSVVKFQQFNMSLDSIRGCLESVWLICHIDHFGITVQELGFYSCANYCVYLVYFFWNVRCCCHDVKFGS